ncbi:glycoside hydrolase family 27 protein [Opitutus sp. ER46]|uniref:glycoside hydrolase family 27 protein n=1 Tax=Opitutus sp. ER46 TaxID=2161864 RepID=UPI000D320557|nr:glycoside hydrolase family 27 protein [Opitutus sp. ER46]PTX91399.1 alpha-galactosidase [Opitutus sp. ER46]
MRKPLALLLASTLALTAMAQKFENLALTPPMGWNTWNTFASDIHESLIKQTADTMVANGMRDAGYVYIVIDDTWSKKQRDEQGNLVPDPAKFPSGMKALADYLHERGFKLGIYSCAGPRTCADYPGSWGHEFQDARTFAAWGIDYLKYDWCNRGNADARDAYTRIRDALYTAGRPVVLSICEWGQNKPWEWASGIGHLWRTSGDIYDSYDGRKGWEMGWKRILDLQYSLVDSIGPDGIGKYAGPGHWNDPDMLEVGNAGLSMAESRAHFSLWCILAAPLMAGNDVRHMKPEIQAILTDREVIAIDQDKLGKQGFRALAEPARAIEIWIKPLSEGDWAVCALNTGNAPADLTIDWERLWTLDRRPYQVRDLWAKRAAGDTTKPLTVRVDTHDVALFRLTPAK